MLVRQDITARGSRMSKVYVEAETVVINTIKLKSSSFSVITLETLETGVTILRLKQGLDEMAVPLLPEELGILLTKFGNSIVDGRVEELRRLEEHHLELEERKISG